MAVKLPGSMPLALLMAMSALVLAGLPTTSTLASALALAPMALPCDGEDGAVGREQVAALHARLAGHGADEDAHVGVAERDVGVVGADHAGEQREGAVVELHRHAVERLQRRA